MTMRLALALRGQLRDHMKAEDRALREADESVVRESTVDLKGAYRGEVRAGFDRGNRVANAVRDKYFRDRDGSLTGFVYSKFGKKKGGTFQDYLARHERGGEQESSRPGGWMFIAARGASRRVKQARRSLDMLGKDPKLALIRIGPNRTVFVRRTSKRRTVLLGWMVRNTRLKATLDFRRHERRLTRVMATKLVNHWERRAQAQR